MTTTNTAAVVRIRAKSGSRDNDHWQAQCTACGWQGAYYSNRTVEGRRLATQRAEAHRCSTTERTAQ